MKIKLQKMLKHNWRTLLLLLTLVTTSQGVWADTTYYVYGVTTRTEASDIIGLTEEKARATGTNDNPFTVTLTTESSTGTYYYGICRSSEKFLPNSGSSGDWNDAIHVNSSSGNSDIDCGGFGATVNGCSYLLFKVVLKTAAATSKAYSFTFTKDSYSHQSCDKSQSRWNVSLEGGDTPITINTWELRGSFNDWGEPPYNVPRILEFVKDGDKYVKSINLSESKVYTFKIKIKDTDTWYGYSTAINKDTSFPVGFSTSGNDCSITTDLAGTYVFSFTLNGSGEPQLTVVYPSKVSTEPTIRWGNGPTIDMEKNISCSAYIAKLGCDYDEGEHGKVTQLKVRFWKEGEETNVGYMETAESLSGYSVGTLYNVVDGISGKTTIPATNSILLSCSEETRIYMEVAGKSEIGWSDYSDQVSVLYQANNEFVTISDEATFTACDGEHDVDLTDIMLPYPEKGWSVRETSPSVVADAKSDFIEENGNLTWITTGKSSGDYVYVFTFEKDGYEDGVQEFTIHYTAPESFVGDISSISVNSDETYPYRTVLMSTVVSGDITSVQWYVKKYESSAIITNDGITSSQSNATFRSKNVAMSRTYTIYAKGLTDDCGATEEKSQNITVNPDTEVCPK